MIRFAINISYDIHRVMELGIQKTRKCINENQIHINTKDAGGRTLLHHVARLRVTDSGAADIALSFSAIIKYLLNEGASINVQDNKEFTPLDLAINFFDIGAGLLLLQHVAETNKPDIMILQGFIASFLLCFEHLDLYYEEADIFEIVSAVPILGRACKQDVNLTEDKLVYSTLDVQKCYKASNFRIDRCPKYTQ